jgi:hypothetical protein
MNREQAKDAAADMYRAHGREAPEGVIARLAFAMLEARCGVCALEAVRDAGETGGKPLTVPMLHEALAARMNNPSHLPHISMNTTQAVFADEEKFWRSDGAKAIETGLGCTPLEAQYLAAKMWGSRAVPMVSSQIADEFEPVYGVADIWTAHFRQVQMVTKDAVEGAFTMSRQALLKEVS